MTGNKTNRLNTSFHKMIVVNKRLLDSNAAADYLSISRAKLYQWVDAGKVHSLKIDNKRLFDVLDLDEFVDNLKKEQGTN